MVRDYFVIIVVNYVNSFSAKPTVIAYKYLYLQFSSHPSWNHSLQINIYFSNFPQQIEQIADGKYARMSIYIHM